MRSLYTEPCNYTHFFALFFFREGRGRDLDVHQEQPGGQGVDN